MVSHDITLLVTVFTKCMPLGEAYLNNTEQSFVEDGGVSTDQRKMNAVRAYFEWWVETNANADILTADN